MSRWNKKFQSKIFRIFQNETKSPLERIPVGRGYHLLSIYFKVSEMVLKHTIFNFLCRIQLRVPIYILLCNVLQEPWSGHGIPACLACCE